MKNLFKTMIAVLAVGTLVLSSCNKYEEGANFSIRSKKGRLAGEWTATKVTVGGTDVTSSFLPSGATYKVTYEKGGSWTSAYTFASVTNTEAGTWEFVDSKEKLKSVTTGSADTDGDTSIIVQLKNKDLKLKSGTGTNETIITFVQN